MQFIYKPFQIIRKHTNTQKSCGKEDLSFVVVYQIFFMIYACHICFLIISNTKRFLKSRKTFLNVIILCNFRLRPLRLKRIAFLHYMPACISRTKVYVKCILNIRMISFDCSFKFILSTSLLKQLAI